MELQNYFTKYLKKIQPSRANRERAIQLHRTLRSRLEKIEDDTFREWYRDSFLYGSYARNTAIHPIKDVDVCLLLDIEITSVEPETVIRKLKSVLEKLGYEDKTAYQRRSIRIDMSGTTMDAVPVVALEGEDRVLRIPDRKVSQWILTHPKAHMEAAKNLNKESGGRYVPLVKLAKAWYSFQAKERRGIERPKPKGFTLEVLLANFFDPDAPTYAEAFVGFLSQMQQGIGASLRNGVFPKLNDPGLPGDTLKVTLDADETKLFAEIVAESYDLAARALDTTDYRESASLWREVFGNRFPDAPQSKKASEQVIDQEDFELDSLIEAEICEPDIPTEENPGQTFKLTAGLAQRRGGHIYQQYPSASRALPKNVWICFHAANIPISTPYLIKWTVENHGQEAVNANDPGHWSTTGDDKPFKWEVTKYRGTHHMTCEIIKNGTVVARKKHVVSIK